MRLSMRIYGMVPALLVLIVCVAAVAFPAAAVAATLVVPDDYNTIQGAVDATVPGDTVLVRPGTYDECVTITQCLMLKGNYRSDTIIAGDGSPVTVTVSGTSNVRIYGFTVRTGGNDGVVVSNCTHVTISDCEMTANGRFGIHLHNADNTRITNCYSHDNGTYGIVIAGGSDDVAVDYCQSSHNAQHGIISGESPHNLVIRYCNSSSNGGIGIGVNWAVGGTVQSCTVIGNHEGVMFDGTYGVTVEDCTISNNEIGVVATFGAHDNTVRDCTIEWNDVGVLINNSDIGHPTYGHHFYHNEFIHNTDQVSEQPPNQGAERQVWDDGYPSGGNSWSDYVGEDHFSGPNQNLPGSDGIGDTPYWVTVLAKDNYPLFRGPCPIEARSWGSIKAMFR